MQIAERPRTRAWPGFLAPSDVRVQWQSTRNGGLKIGDTEERGTPTTTTNHSRRTFPILLHGRPQPSSDVPSSHPFSVTSSRALSAPRNIGIASAFCPPPPRRARARYFITPSCHFARNLPLLLAAHDDANLGLCIGLLNVPRRSRETERPMTSGAALESVRLDAMALDTCCKRDNLCARDMVPAPSRIVAGSTQSCRAWQGARSSLQGPCCTLYPARWVAWSISD